MASNSQQECPREKMEGRKMKPMTPEFRSSDGLKNSSKVNAMAQCSLDASPDAASHRAVCGSRGVRLCLAHLQLSLQKEGAALVLSPDLPASYTLTASSLRRNGNRWSEEGRVVGWELFLRSYSSPHFSFLPP